jgi:outer membrane lipoprotein-sorting protein
MSRFIKTDAVKAYQIFILIVCPVFTCSSARLASDTESLLNKMEAAYAEVKDYQTEVKSRVYQRDGSKNTKKFLYTFKKPNWIRLDFELPHPGMILVYPDKNGKVVIHPSGWIRFFKLHLSPDSFLLKDASKQRIDQTDLGLLIRNISHSLTDQRRGPVEVSEDDGRIELRVLADDHFRKGVTTRYRFLIDKELWLPAGVEELTPNGILKRTVTFRNLRMNIGVSDCFFQLKE